jgi:hypothetical protein
MGISCASNSPIYWLYSEYLFLISFIVTKKSGLPSQDTALFTAHFYH